MIFRRQTEKERRAKEEAEDARWRAAEDARVQREFDESPAGRARASFAGGARLFQITLSLGRQGDKDLNKVLNQILAEGWQLHSFATASRTEGATRNGSLSLTGTLYGTYLFTRDPDVDREN